MKAVRVAASPFIFRSIYDLLKRQEITTHAFYLLVLILAMWIPVVWGISSHTHPLNRVIIECILRSGSAKVPELGLCRFEKTHWIVRPNAKDVRGFYNWRYESIVFVYTKALLIGICSYILSVSANRTVDQLDYPRTSVKSKFEPTVTDNPIISPNYALNSSIFHHFKTKRNIHSERMKYK